jgi:hypothetical protein
MISFPLRDLAERALSSAGEQFLAVVTAGGAMLSVAGLPWKLALATAAGAAVGSVLLSVGQYATGTTKLPYALDVTVRVVKTFAASLAATLGAGAVNVLDVPWRAALNVAAVAALLTLVKCVLAASTHTTGASLIRQPVDYALPEPVLRGSHHA